ncbi:MAG TPA: MarR family transcriptional regulator [Actinomycetota bacterium]|nr:MarR family transcriptional regulator [Actinomycetota bacterium]
MSRRSRRELLEEVLLASRATQNAADALDDAVTGLLGLNRTDVLFLDVLDRLGRVTAGRLAVEARLTTGAVTRVLDRLEKAGYVRRVADPSDRRRVLIEATQRARRVGHEAYGPIAEAVMGSEQRFTQEQLEGILEFFRLGRELNLRRAEEIRGQMGARRRPRPPLSRAGSS